MDLKDSFIKGLNCTLGITQSSILTLRKGIKICEDSSSDLKLKKFY